MSFQGPSCENVVGGQGEVERRRKMKRKRVEGDDGSEGRDVGNVQGQ